MTGLLDTSPLDRMGAVRRLEELRGRARQLTALSTGLVLAGGVLLAMGHSFGVPLMIGAAGALGLWGLCRSDRHRFLVLLVAQGDAWALEGVREVAERLLSVRERQRMAHGLRAAAAAGMPGAQVSMMVDPARAADVGDRLVALADRFADPLVKISAQAAAICRRLLCDAQHSPLYNPRIPERDLRRVLDVIERDLASLA